MFAHIIDWVVFLQMIVKSYVSILDTSPLSHIQFANILFQWTGCHFSLSFLFVYYIILLFFIIQFTLVSLFSLLLPPTLSPQLPQAIPPPCPCPWILYLCCFAGPFCFFSLLFPSSSPLVIVSLFFISMSLVLFCSLVCFLIRFHL